MAVVGSYYAALARGDLEGARALRTDPGAVDEERLADVEGATFDVDVGNPGRIEGAAGSRYVRVPVELRIGSAPAEVRCRRGSVTLRRAVVDGATAEQRAWRVDAEDLRACEAAEAAGVRLRVGPPGVAPAQAGAAGRAPGRPLDDEEDLPNLERGGDMALLDGLLTIERALWTGGADAYREHLDDECLIAFTEMAGVSSREEVAGMVEGSSRWKDLEIEGEGIVRPSDDVAILVYRVSGLRDGEERYRARAGSAYARRDGAWKMAFHQQTPLPE